MHLIKSIAKAIVPQLLVNFYSDLLTQRSLPPAAKRLKVDDARGLPLSDPGPEVAIQLATRWLCRAQDKSSTADGGVSHSFSLVTGWAPSYPETTGYIVPTLLAESNETGNRDLLRRARRMLDWLVDIQYPEGGFQGGLVNHTPKLPVTFNTGQILIGLAIGARELEDANYLRAMHKAAAWLVDTLDDDGCWRKFPTPFAAPGEKAYETHVSWGLFEAECTAPGRGYAKAGLKQVDWAIGKQHGNGWLESNCLTQPEAPLTHTIGYVLRGILEAHAFSEDGRCLAAAVKLGDGLLTAIEEDGRLPGRLDCNWNPRCDWICLTGSVQIAHCYFLLYGHNRERRFLDAALRLNRFVRRTLIVDGEPDVVGGVRGSFPVNGEYGKFQFLNWAAKFLIDSNRAELAI